MSQCNDTSYRIVDPSSRSNVQEAQRNVEPPSHSRVIVKQEFLNCVVQPLNSYYRYCEPHYPVETTSSPTVPLTYLQSQITPTLVTEQLYDEISTQENMNIRAKFYMFIKVLLRILDDESLNVRENVNFVNEMRDDTETDDALIQKEKRLLFRLKAKAIIRSCTYRNRLGDVNCQNLMYSIEYKLRPHVGERMWTKAQVQWYRLLLMNKKGVKIQKIQLI
jgi:hypothetical protein